MISLKEMKNAVDMEYARCVEENIPTPASIAYFYQLLEITKAALADLETTLNELDGDK